MRVGEVAPDVALRQGAGSALWTSAGPLRRTEDLRDPEPAPDRRDGASLFTDPGLRCPSASFRPSNESPGDSGAAPPEEPRRRRRGDLETSGALPPASLRSPLPADERSCETFARPSYFRGPGVATFSCGRAELRLARLSQPRSVRAETVMESRLAGRGSPLHRGLRLVRRWTGSGDSGRRLGRQGAVEAQQEELLVDIRLGVPAQDQRSAVCGWEVDVEHLYAGDPRTGSGGRRAG